MQTQEAVADATPSPVPAILREYGALTRAALKRYLPKGEPRRYFYDLLEDYPGRGGKMMRPSLCIAAARMFGAAVDDVLPTAAAIELLHNALLIHDDIEDESELRRGRPTLHRLHGVPLALNAGDGLTLAMFRPLLHNRTILGDTLSLRVLEETERMAIETTEGQALELGWRRDNELNLDDADYLEMVLKKTCWLATIFPLRAGALIGSRGTANLDAFIRFGFLIGAAFQIQDDLLNLVADERYGKERDGDLWEGKRTLILINAASRASAGERERLANILGRSRKDRGGSEIAWMRTLIDKYDSVEYSRQIAQGLAGAAQEELSLLSDLPAATEKTFLERMTIWVIERK